MHFTNFAAGNRERCESPDGFNHSLQSWSLSDWFTAVLGELGEAANIAKKLNRVRDGIPGNKVSAGELRDMLEGELADAFIYLDLLCQSQGIVLEDAVVRTWNRKCHEIGYPILIERKTDKTAREIELEDLLTSARAIAARKGADTAWERFDERLAKAGIGSVTAKVFKVLPSDTEVV